MARRATTRPSPRMRGGSCAAGPSVEVGPSWRRGLNWPRCATLYGLNRTAEGGKSPPSFWSSATEVGTEDEKWTRLGETQRVAVMECWRGRGSQPVPPSWLIGEKASDGRTDDSASGGDARRARRAKHSHHSATGSSKGHHCGIPNKLQQT